MQVLDIVSGGAPAARPDMHVLKDGTRVEFVAAMDALARQFLADLSGMGH